MRKLLLILLALGLLVLAGYTVVYGITIGDLTINSVTDIKEENEILEKKIQEASELRNKDYPDSMDKLETAYKGLATEKQNYEQLLALGVDENGQQLSKIQKYEIEKIWITMGNYAKKQGVELKLDVTLNNSISGTYDLTFTVQGGYIQIADFLTDVENDSTLVFKLENFKMTPGSATEIETTDANGQTVSTTVSAEDNLMATFVCKDVNLNISGVEGSSNNTENETTDSSTTDSSTSTNGASNTTGNTTNTNNTSNTTGNTTSTNSTSNTTNTTNTSNTTGNTTN
mgnify:FL=1